MTEHITRLEFEAFQKHIQEAFMATQADIDAITQSVGQVATDLTTLGTDLQAGLAAVQTEINNLQASDQSIDLSALQAAVAPLDGSVQSLITSAEGLATLAPQPTSE